MLVDDDLRVLLTVTPPLNSVTTNRAGARRAR
jgi:hypothetical protein